MKLLSMMVAGVFAAPANLPSGLPAKFRHSNVTNDTREVLQYMTQYDMDCQYSGPNPGPSDGCSNSSQISAEKVKRYKCGDWATAPASDEHQVFWAATGKCDGHYADTRARLFLFCSEDGTSIYKAWYVEDNSGLGKGNFPLADLLDADVSWNSRKQEHKDCYESLGFIDEEIDVSQQTSQCKNTDATVSDKILDSKCSATMPPPECHEVEHPNHCFGGCTVEACHSWCCIASGGKPETLSFTRLTYDLRESSYRCGDDGNCQYAQNGMTWWQCQPLADTVCRAEPSPNTFQCLSGQCVPAHDGVGIETCENLCGMPGQDDDLRNAQAVV